MNPFASHKNEELFLILAILGICGVILLIGTFAASIYIEKLSANDDCDLERQNDRVTQSELIQLRHWVESIVQKSVHVKADHMQLQQEKTEAYVRERLGEHFTILAMKSPPFQGYGTFTPRGGTSTRTSFAESTASARVKTLRK